MPLHKVENLKQRIKGGAKQDKFTLLINPPAGAPQVGFVEDDYCLVKQVAFVSRRLGKVEAWVQGRKLIIPGDIEFDNEVQFTLYNSPNHDMRQKIIDWMDLIDNYEHNWHTSNPWPLTTTIELMQMDGQGNSLKTYKLMDCFPLEVGSIDMDAANINQITTFTVKFAYSHDVPQPPAGVE